MTTNISDVRIWLTTKKQVVQAQETFFKLGAAWSGNYKEILGCSAPTALYCTSIGSSSGTKHELSYYGGKQYFEIHNHRKITLKELISTPKINWRQRVEGQNEI